MRRFSNLIRNHTNWLSYLKYKLFSGKKKPFVFKTRGGLSIEVPPRLLHTYKECFLDESYLKGFGELSNIQTIVDIGANVGYFSLFMLNKYPEASVYAFEPMPNNFELLNNYRQQYSALKFFPFNMAVGKMPGELTLNYNANDSFSTSATIFDNSNEPDSITVNMTSLEELIQTSGLSIVDFLKLDCEGSEYPILYNAPKEVLYKINYMAIETHSGNGEKENIRELSLFLEQNGFMVKRIEQLIWCKRT